MRRGMSLMELSDQPACRYCGRCRGHSRHGGDGWNWSFVALFDRGGGSLVWSLSGEKPTSGQSAQNDAVDPERHFATVSYCAAKGSFRGTGTMNVKPQVERLNPA